MTNYERIKQMSVDEMAIYLDCPNGADVDICIPDKKSTCFYCVKKWLESEVKE